jgi:hypothetical protein
MKRGEGKVNLSEFTYVRPRCLCRRSSLGWRRSSKREEFWSRKELVHGEAKRKATRHLI